VCRKASGLTYQSRAKWKRPRGIYSAIYSEVNVSVSVCVEIKGDHIEKYQSCLISVTLKSWPGRKHLDPPSYIRSDTATQGQSDHDLTTSTKLLTAVVYTV
jgi:hypothetical protein